MKKYNIERLVDGMKENRFGNIYLETQRKVDSNSLKKIKAVTTENIMNSFMNDLTTKRISIKDFANQYLDYDILAITDIEKIAYKVVTQDVIAEIMEQRIHKGCKTFLIGTESTRLSEKIQTLIEEHYIYLKGDDF